MIRFRSLSLFFSADFPYIATRAELDKYTEPFVPWHWHSSVELFYMESGALEYTTPNGKLSKTSDPITQIAFSCGFGSSSYFGKVFHEKYDCSPLMYRNAMARF